MKKHFDLIIGEAGIRGLRLPLKFRDFTGGYFDAFMVEAWTSVEKSQNGARFGLIKDAVEKIFDEEMEFKGLFSRVDSFLGYAVNYSGSGSAGISLESVFTRDPFSSDVESVSVVPLRVSGIVKDGARHFSLSVTVTGMNACPCTMDATAKLLGIEGSSERPFSVTHNQRTKITAELTFNKIPDVDFLDLADCLHRSTSGVLMEKASDELEAEIVVNSHKNPLFVEDSVRIAASLIVQDLRPDPDVLIRVDAVSLESIHNHDAFASLEMKAADLK